MGGTEARLVGRGHSLGGGMGPGAVGPLTHMEALKLLQQQENAIHQAMKTLLALVATTMVDMSPTTQPSPMTPQGPWILPTAPQQAPS